MNISNLIESAPELMNSLQGLGLNDKNISDMADGIGQQLGGEDGFDFTDLLTGLQAGNFLDQIDTGALAEKALVSPELAQQAVQLIAPIVANFGGGEGAMGMLGKLAGGLFGKK